MRSIKSLYKLKKIKIKTAVFITLSIAILSLIKINKSPITIKNIDKLEHLIAYFFLTISWLLAMGKNKQRNFVILSICIIYGMIIEVLQVQLTTYRNGDYYDIIANTIGVFLAFIIFYTVFYKKYII